MNTPAPAASPTRVMPAWLVLTLVTLVLWGGWGFVSKPVSGNLSAWQIQSFSTLGLLPVIAVLWRRGKSSVPQASRKGFWLAFGSGLLGSVGNAAYYQALAVGGKVAAVTPLTALYPLVTILLALAVLRERLNLIQAAGIALSLGAIYFFNLASETGWLNAWLAVALVPILFWGLAALLQKLAANLLSPDLATAAFLAGELPFAVLIPAFAPMKWSLPAASWMLLLALGFLFALGNLTLICAYARGGKAAVVTPIASLYSIVTIPLAMLFLGEQLTGRESVGIACALVATVALSWESPPPPATPAST